MKIRINKTKASIKSMLYSASVEPFKTDWGKKIAVYLRTIKLYIKRTRLALSGYKSSTFLYWRSTEKKRLKNTLNWGVHFYPANIIPSIKDSVPHRFIFTAITFQRWRREYAMACHHNDHSYCMTGCTLYRATFHLLFFWLRFFIKIILTHNQTL